MAQLHRDVPALRARGFDLVAVSGDGEPGIATMRRIAGEVFEVLQDPAGELIAALGVLDLDEHRGHPVAVPSTYFVDSRGVIQGVVRARDASDRPRSELLLLAAERFSEQRRR